jgi:hypothetical protein
MLRKQTKANHTIQDMLSSVEMENDYGPMNSRKGEESHDVWNTAVKSAKSE